MNDRARLVAYTLGLWAVGVVVGTAVAPPDPYTQLMVVVNALVLGPMVAYWLVVVRGSDPRSSRKA